MKYLYGLTVVMLACLAGCKKISTSPGGGATAAAHERRRL